MELKIYPIDAEYDAIVKILYNIIKMFYIIYDILDCLT